MQLDLDAPPRMSLRREEWCAWCIAKNGVPGVPGASREAPAALLEAAGLTPKPAEAYPAIIFAGAEARAWLPLKAVARGGARPSVRFMSSSRKVPISCRYLPPAAAAGSMGINS